MSNDVQADIAAKIQPAAVAEAARLCAMALAGHARLSADTYLAPSLAPRDVRLAKAKRYQLNEFRPDFKRIQRIVLDTYRFETREDFLAAVDFFCAVGRAEVERLFANAI